MRKELPCQRGDARSRQSPREDPIGGGGSSKGSKIRAKPDFPPSVVPSWVVGPEFGSMEPDADVLGFGTVVGSGLVCGACVEMGRLSPAQSDPLRSLLARVE